MSERLQKLLAGAGHGSRRGIEDWIRAGRITVNDRVAQLGDRASAADQIRLDGKLLDLGGSRDSVEVLLYNKPLGEVTTRNDPEGRPTVFDHLPAPISGRWIVVGRLDVNTGGLLLFTNDGELAHRLMHPSSEVEREYRVRLRGAPGPEVIDRLLKGVTLEDGPASFDRIHVESTEGSHSWFRVELHEGRNREVRRLFEHEGYEVSRLTRIRYGSAVLPPDLRAGGFIRLDPSSVAALSRLVDAHRSTPAGGLPEDSPGL